MILLQSCIFREGGKYGRNEPRFKNYPPLHVAKEHNWLLWIQKKKTFGKGRCQLSDHKIEYNFRESEISLIYLSVCFLK